MTFNNRFRNRPPQRPDSRRRGAFARVYTKDGRTLRVPLRAGPAGSSTGTGCRFHPERQFIRWFGRYAAANPGFPVGVKNILLVADDPLCPHCNDLLNRYLDRYRLGGRLRLRTWEPRKTCGCAHGGGAVAAQALRRPTYLVTRLDELLHEVQAAALPRALPPAEPYRRALPRFAAANA
jgi:hypothetical protein